MATPQKDINEAFADIANKLYRKEITGDQFDQQVDTLLIQHGKIIPLPQDYTDERER